MANKSSDVNAPWYVVVCRIFCLFFISLGLWLFIFFGPFLVDRALASLFDSDSLIFTSFFLDHPWLLILWGFASFFLSVSDFLFRLSLFGGE